MSVLKGAREEPGSLRERFPKVGQLMDAAEHEVLAYMGFPRAHWLQIHSTNLLERLNAEVKRRTDVVGIFPNDAAVVRLVGAMLLEQSDEWTLQRRHIQLEGLQCLSSLSGPWTYTTPRDTTSAPTPGAAGRPQEAHAKATRSTG